MQYCPAVSSVVRVPDFNFISVIINLNIMDELIENCAALWHESYEKKVIEIVKRGKTGQKLPREEYHILNTYNDVSLADVEKALLHLIMIMMRNQFTLQLVPDMELFRLSISKLNGMLAHSTRSMRAVEQGDNVAVPVPTLIIVREAHQMSLVWLWKLREPNTR